MRFRASIINVPTFFKIIQAVEKLQKKCIIKFSPDKMHIICANESNEGGIQVWSQINVDSLFQNYRIQSNADNEITISLLTEALLGALRSGAASSGSGGNSSGNAGPGIEAEEVIMKLTKKNDVPVLSFEITGTSRVGHSLRVNHDVKIDVLKTSEVALLKEPLCPEPDVHIILPSLQKLRTIVDRLRPMSDILSVKANLSKRLQLGINTESVRVEVDWRDCPNPNTGQNDEEDAQMREGRDLTEMHTVLISTKGFLKFLNSHVVSSTTIACLCQHHCLILYVYIGDVQAAHAGGVLTYYIPAIIDDEGR